MCFKCIYRARVSVHGVVWQGVDVGVYVCMHLCMYIRPATVIAGGGGGAM